MTRLSRRTYLATAAVAGTGLVGYAAPETVETTTDKGSGTNSRGASNPPVTPVASEVTVEAETPALIDADPRIVVAGLNPNSRVGLTATSTSGDGRTWESKACFRADPKGMVRVFEQAPVEGSYEGVNHAGLLWSMQPTTDLPPKLTHFSIDGDAYDATVTATVNGRTVAETTLVRRTVAPDVTTKPVDAENVVGTFASPDVDDPRPGVLVLHVWDGGPRISVAKMLASRGIPALALKYIGSEDPIPHAFREVPLSYFARAAEWLRDQPAVRDDKLGLYGFERGGGEGALFLAAYADWVGAVVARTPSSLAFEGLTVHPKGWAGASPWLVDGEPVPYVSGDGSASGTTEEGLLSSASVTDEDLLRIATIYEAALSRADEETVADATFPIEHCDGPIFCFAGNQDGVMPQPRLIEIGVDRLKEHDAGDRIEHRAYEEAGFIIRVPYRPTYGTTKSPGFDFGGTPAGNARASADWWPRALETFGHGLG